MSINTAKSLSHLSMRSEPTDINCSSRALGLVMLALLFCFGGEVASTDCITVYLGQGVFSSSSGLFTALYLPTGCWHRMVPSEKLVSLSRKTLCFRVHVGMFEEMCRIVVLFLDWCQYDPVLENN